MNVYANIDRVVYDAIINGVAYPHTIEYYSTLSTSLAHVMYQLDQGEGPKYFTYTMSRDLYESLSQGEFYLYRMSPLEVQVGYDTLTETKEEKRERLERWLQEAIEEEDYEEAARLRDLLKG